MQGSNHELKVLMRDAATGFYRMQRYRVGDFFGPVDLGIHLAFKHNALTSGAELLTGSVFLGSNRFNVSSIRRSGLVFDNLGINTPLTGVRMEQKVQPSGSPRSRMGRSINT